MTLSINSAHAVFECTVQKAKDAAYNGPSDVQTFMNQCFKKSKASKYDKTLNPNAYEALVKSYCKKPDQCSPCQDLFKDTDPERYKKDKQELDKQNEERNKEYAKQAEQVRKSEKANHDALMNSKGNGNAQSTFGTPD